MKHGLKVLGLSVLAIVGVMAVTAGAAQAHAVVLVNGAQPGAPVAFNGTIGAGELLTVTSSIKIYCTSGTVSGTISGLGSGTALVLFSGCEVLGSGGNCKIKETLSSGAGSIHASGTGLIFKHNGAHYLLVSGSPFTDFVMYGPLCPVTGGEEEHFEVSGSTVLSLPDALTNQATHQIVTLTPATVASLFPNHDLFLGSEPSHLAGGSTATVSLTGGGNWKVD